MRPTRPAGYVAPALAQSAGERYRAYAARHKRLIPLIW
jgi:protein-S-isoprenylcysteine O-methyltransferase Ste14